jgi:alanine dehydrogenase
MGGIPGVAPASVVIIGAGSSCVGCRESFLRYGRVSGDARPEH